MDRVPPARAAAMLGVSRRRLLAAAARLGVGEKVDRRTCFDANDIEVLRHAIGFTPRIAGLSRTQSVVLAELARRPLGLVSARAVARACGISPTAASAAVRRLVDEGLITETRTMVALGEARVATMLLANTRHPRWPWLAPQLRCVLPPSTARVRAARIPNELRHVFWNVDGDTLTSLSINLDGAFIAARALTTGDPQLLAFAAANLDGPAWESAARIRGLSQADRDFALNAAGRST